MFHSLFTSLAPIQLISSVTFPRSLCTVHRSLPTSSTCSPASSPHSISSRITLAATITQITRHPHVVHNSQVYFIFHQSYQVHSQSRVITHSRVHFIPHNRKSSICNSVLDSNKTLSLVTSIKRKIKYMGQSRLGKILLKNPHSTTGDRSGICFRLTLVYCFVFLRRRTSHGRQNL